MPGEPRSQLHQLPKNPLSELPVVKCKVGQCHSEQEGLVSEGLKPRQPQPILAGFLILESNTVSLMSGQRKKGLVLDRGNSMRNNVTQGVADKLLLKQTVKERCVKQSDGVVRVSRCSRGSVSL